MDQLTNKSPDSICLISINISKTKMFPPKSLVWCFFLQLLFHFLKLTSQFHCAGPPATVDLFLYSDERVPGLKSAHRVLWRWWWSCWFAPGPWCTWRPSSSRLKLAHWCLEAARAAEKFKFPGSPTFPVKVHDFATKFKALFERL